jgi:riboflavin-specific deaminase-like protein
MLWDPDEGWKPGRNTPTAISELLDLYLPLCGRSAQDTLTVGHLGQSLDGCIATHSGDSCHVTGRQNIRHLHRMRGLCDAVLVGTETVARDDPQLTTRLVPGRSPVRVVLDRVCRLRADHRVFTDGKVSTLVVCAAERKGKAPSRIGDAEVIFVPTGRGDGLNLQHLLAILHERGLRRIFVEGGGVTVSSFLDAGLLDRLQVAVAPLLIGSGRRGLRLPPRASMDDCLRLRCRTFQMGCDVLFDCELEREPGAQEGRDGSDAGQDRVY